MEPVFYTKTTFGSHLSFSKKLKDTFKNAIIYGMYSFQFYMGSSRSYGRTEISDEDLKSTLKLCERYPINVFTHCCLLYNLAGNIKQKKLAWVDRDLDNMMYSMIKGIEYELNLVSKFPTKNGCVIHVGSWPDLDKGIKAIATSINKINFPKNSTLLLENTAGKGTTIGKTFEQLKNIFDLVEKKENIKFCLDTCHIFASGVYDIRKKEEIDKLFSDFDSIFGLEKLGLIHFNDSFFDFDSQKDQHMCIGEGKIWKGNMKECKYFLELVDKYQIPLVLETHPSDIDVIQRL